MYILNPNASCAKIHTSTKFGDRQTFDIVDRHHLPAGPLAEAQRPEPQVPEAPEVQDGQEFKARMQKNL